MSNPSASGLRAQLIEHADGLERFLTGRGTAISDVRVRVVRDQETER